MPAWFGQHTGHPPHIRVPLAGVSGDKNNWWMAVGLPTASQPASICTEAKLHAKVRFEPITSELLAPGLSHDIISLRYTFIVVMRHWVTEISNHPVSISYHSLSSIWSQLFTNFLTRWKASWMPFPFKKPHYIPVTCELITDLKCAWRKSLASWHLFS